MKFWKCFDGNELIKRSFWVILLVALVLDEEEDTTGKTLPPNTTDSIHHKQQLKQSASDNPRGSDFFIHVPPWYQWWWMMPQKNDSGWPLLELSSCLITYCLISYFDNYQSSSSFIITLLSFSIKKNTPQDINKDLSYTHSSKHVTHTQFTFT